MALDPLRLLLLDDDEHQHSLFDHTLARTGLAYALDCSRGIYEALALISEGEYDLCFVDYLLDGATGVEFIRACSARAIDTPMIVLTGYQGREAAVEALEAGATDFLRKDRLDADVLERSIRYAIERSRIMKAYRASEERLLTTISRALIAIFAADADGVITFADGKVLEILGLTKDVLIGVSIAARFGENGPLMAGLSHVMSGHEFKGLIPMGDVLLECHATPTFTADGLFSGLIGVATDVTAQKITEERLERSQRLFESFMNHSPILNFIKDADGRYLFVNEAFSRLVKRPIGEIIGRIDPELWSPEIADEFRRNDEQVRAADRSLVFVERANDDGRIVISHVVKFPIHTDDGDSLLGGIAVDISGRVEAEESLRKSEERFLLSARATNDVVYDWNLRTDAIWWNENLTTRFGYPPDAGQYDLSWWKRTVHPQDYERVVAELEEAVAVGAETFNAEYRFARADGSFATVVDRGCLVYDEHRRPVRMIGAMIDVTERVEAEEELRRREEEYRRIVETAQEGIWVTDNRGVTTFVNATMARMLGQTIESMLGTKFERYLDEEAREFARRNKERRERGLAEQYDLQMLRSDGSRIWTIVSANPIVSRDGQLVGSLAMVTDITERKIADAAVRSSEERFRRIVETAQEGIWMVDAQDRTTFVNARMAAILGRTIDDLLGRTVDEIVPDFEVADMRDRLKLRRLGISEHYELELRRPDGERLWTLVAANPVFEPDGRYGGSLAMVTDITPRRRAELALLEAHDRLEQRVQERTAALATTMRQLEKAHSAQKRFVADASHDLRTPLTVVRAELELLLGSPTLDAATRESLRRAASEVHRLDHLASDLLALATIDSQDLGAVRTPTRLDELLLESISNLAPIARERSINWNIDIDDAVEIACNREALQRAIANVLENALKYSRRDGTVDIRFRRTGAEARIEVADSGIGIGAEDLPRIYDRFYRSDAARSTPGTGLGLPIVKSVVEAHGGTVAVDSAQGAGTTVTIVLPIDAKNSES